MFTYCRRYLDGRRSCAAGSELWGRGTYGTAARTVLQERRAREPRSVSNRRKSNAQQPLLRALLSNRIRPKIQITARNTLTHLKLDPERTECFVITGRNWRQREGPTGGCISRSTATPRAGAPCQAVAPRPPARLCAGPRSATSLGRAATSCFFEHIRSRFYDIWSPKTDPGGRSIWILKGSERCL